MEQTLHTSSAQFRLRGVRGKKGETNSISLSWGQKISFLARACLTPRESEEEKETFSVRGGASSYNFWVKPDQKNFLSHVQRREIEAKKQADPTFFMVIFRGISRRRWP